MTYFGVLLGLVITWALWSPKTFGAHLAKIASGYRAALQQTESGNG